MRRFAVLLLTLLSIHACAQESEALRAKLEELRVKFGFPGVSAAYVKPNGEVVAAAVGMADVEQSVPMTPHHRLLAGSTGKTYFSAAALQVFKEHQVSLDQPIATWFAGEPWFVRIPHADKITINHLMHHSSGIHDHVRNPKLSEDLMKSPDKSWSPAELLSYIPADAAPFEPGGGFEYADTNYIVVAMIVEKLTGQTAYDEISKRLLLPLGLERTVPSISREIPDLACGYSAAHPPFTVKGRMIEDGQLVFNPQMEWGGGGFASNPSELARWAFSIYGGNVLSEDLKTMMLDGIKSNIGPQESYGLGVQIRPSKYGTSYGHSGWFPGYMTDMAYFPDVKVAAAIQFNTDVFRQIGMNPGRYLEEFVGLATGSQRPASPPILASLMPR